MSHPGRGLSDPLQHRYFEDRRSRENYQRQRILASKEDERVHAINLIIKRTGNGRGTTIPYLDFNFESGNDAYHRDFRPFLEELKSTGCIDGYERAHLASGQAKISFFGVNTSNLVKFREKIAAQQLHSLQEVPVATQVAMHVRLQKDKDKLLFWKTGEMEYKNEQGRTKTGTKGNALLTLLSAQKNMPFTIDDLKKWGNPYIHKSEHFFKSEKDVDDTIRDIKYKLGIKKGAYFPIHKRKDGSVHKWVWIEK